MSSSAKTSIHLDSMKRTLIVAMILFGLWSCRSLDYRTFGADNDGKKEDVKAAAFSDLRLSFNYPASWASTNCTTSPFVHLVGIEDSAGSSFLILVYPSAILSAEQLQKTATSAFRSGASKPPRSKDFQEQDAKREFLGGPRAGKSFQDTWGGKKRVTEFFTFEQEGVIFQITLQYFEDRAEAALKGIKIISDSLKHEKV